MNIRMLRLFFGYTLALLVSVSIVERDEWVQSLIEHELCSLIEQMYNCSFQGRIAYFSVLQGRVVLADCNVFDRSGSSEWGWHASEVEVQTNVFSWLRTRKVSCSFIFYSVYFYSLYDLHDLAAFEHIKLLAAPVDPTLSVTMSSCSVKHIDFEFIHRTRDIPLHFDGSLNVTYDPKSLNPDLRMQGECSWFMHHIKCVCQINASSIKGFWSIAARETITGCSFSALSEPKNAEQVHWTFFGDWTDIEQLFELPDFFNKNKIFKASSSGLSGEGIVDLQRMRVCGNLLYGKGALELLFDTGSRAVGLAYECKFKVPLLSISSIELKNVQGTVIFQPTQENFVHAFFDASVQICMGKWTSKVHGDVSIDKKHVAVSVVTDDARDGTLIFEHQEPYKIVRARYAHHGQELCTLRTYADGMSTMAIHELFGNGIIQTFGIDVRMQGQCKINGSFNLLNGSVKAEGKGLRGVVGGVPLVVELYTGAFVYDVLNGVYVYDAKVMFSDGIISVPYAWCTHSFVSGKLYSEALALCSGYRVLSAHGVSAQLSGLCAYENGELIGTVAIDDAYVKGNLMSQEFGQDFATDVKTMPIDLPCHISWLARKPIKVRSDMFNFELSSQGAVEGQCNDPQVHGVLAITKGSILFPYRPLYITSGVLAIDRAVGDPFVQSVLFNLHAKNVIKSYDIMLAVSGNASDPQIELSSYPSLQDRHIITLLYSGSSEGAIASILPQTLFGSLKKLLFGPTIEVSRLQGYLLALLRPLDRVRVIPHIREQEGRGGIRGALEVEVGDRWRAQVEKNFSLSEDVAMHIEYDLSDNASVRAIKDERGDYGVEVGARWRR